MKRMVLSIVSAIVLLTVLINMNGCFSTSISADNLMAGIVAHEVLPSEDISSYNSAVTDFALRLMRSTRENAGENTLISPLSVMMALAMTANGAVGETRREMEETLGMTVEELNLYLYTYTSSLPTNDKNKVSIANSIWFTDKDPFEVNNSFLQKNADYYGAEIYKAPFDNSTKRDINNWVKKETDGMIPKIIDDIPEIAVMYLINTLVFDAEWQKTYEKYQVQDGVFTTESGEKQEAKFMYSDEHRYFSDENSEGLRQFCQTKVFP